MAFIAPEMARVMRATTPYRSNHGSFCNQLAVGRTNILAKPFIPSAHPKGRQCRHKVGVLAVILCYAQ
ncbi:MAG: hypothetical protein INF74_11985 [Roseomonas sp.]|nr:hypothetical protein [Roseomonas sp.]